MANIKILLADDEAQILKDLSDILKEEGYEVSAAKNGVEALEVMKREGTFDLVLTDIMMPGMDGLELLKKIKEIQPNSTVIMLTAHASTEKAIEALKYGAKDFLVKPFKIDEFIVTIQSHARDITKRKKLEKQLKHAHENLEKKYSVLQEDHAQLKRKVDEFKFIEPSEKIKPKLGGEEKKFIDKLGDSALINYTTKEELTNIIEKIIDNFYKNGNPIIFITPQPRAFHRYKGASEFLQEGAIQIIDMRSGLVVGTEPSPHITIPMTHLFLFGDIIRKIPQNSVLIFEPLSQLILARGFETTYQFLENYSEELATRGITFIALLKSSAHSSEDVGGIENIFLTTMTVSDGDIK